MSEEIERCRNRVRSEEQQALSAPNAETAELHRQKAELYRLRLQILERGPTVPSSDGM